jgi:hypothetical protein
MKVPSSFSNLALAATAVLLVSSHPAAGWGNEGHEIVGAIAEANLTPTASATVARLLGSGQSLSSVATWADTIKRQRPETKPWHFIDIPVSAPINDFSHNGDDIVGRLQQFRDDFANSRNSKAKRLEALKFVVHFYGDLHQPLHCAERQGDQGGNLVAVTTYLGRTQGHLNLHQIWDSKILEQSLGSTAIADYASQLNGKVTSEQKSQWGQGTIETWAWETHLLAKDNAYDGLSAGDVEITTEYVQKNQPIVDTQLQKAGIRLADFINKALDPTFAHGSTMLAPRPDAAPADGHALPVTPNGLPDPRLTPGAVFNNLLEEISAWRKFSNLSFCLAFTGPSNGCGHRFSMALLPPSSNAIKWSTSQGQGACSGDML